MTTSHAAAGAAVIRPFQESDLEAAADVAADAFHVDLSGEGAWERWVGRVAYGLETEPEGCFVAERDGEVIGLAEAMQRGPLWILSLLAVRPGVQSGGAGRALMGRSLEYGNPLGAGLIVSSNDARALRLYAASGFALWPAFEASGTVSRMAAEGEKVVRVGGPADLAEVDQISLQVRGAPFAREVHYALGRGGELLLVPGRGFAVALPGNGPWALSALDEVSARALLWAALDRCREAPVRVRWITTAQQWAVDVVLAAGLSLTSYGALGVRGWAGPQGCYLPSAPFG